MRVMLVTMDYPPPMGGIQVVTKNLEEDLKAAGYEVCLLNFDGRNTNNIRKLKPSDFFYTKATRNEYFRPLNIYNPKSLFLPAGYRDFVYNNMIYRDANRARQYFHPDITHILKPTLYTAIFNCEEPYIVSCHGSDVWKTYPVQYSITHAKAIHCVSNYLKELVIQVTGTINKEPAVIYDSVDLNMYIDQRYPRENTIITCCRLVERKNVDSIIRALHLLPLKILSNLKYIVIGDGPEMKNLIELARSLKLNNVEFLGELYGKIKVEWLCRSKLFVLCPKTYTSSFESGQEGFGISYIEAQAAGLPIIGTNQGGIPEAVGNSGLLIEEPLNPEAIASSIQKLLMDEGLYQYCQNNALTRVKQFDRKRIFNQFEQLYQQALS